MLTSMSISKGTIIPERRQVPRLRRLLHADDEQENDFGARQLDAEQQLGLRRQRLRVHGLVPLHQRQQERGRQS